MRGQRSERMALLMVVAHVLAAAAACVGAWYLSDLVLLLLAGPALFAAALWVRLLAERNGPLQSRPCGRCGAPASSVLVLDTEQGLQREFLCRACGEQRLREEGVLW